VEGNISMSNICYWTVLLNEDHVLKFNDLYKSLKKDINFIVFYKKTLNIKYDNIKTISFNSVDEKYDMYLLSMIKNLEKENYDNFCYVNTNSLFLEDPSEKIIDIMKFTPIYTPLQWNIMDKGDKNEYTWNDKSVKSLNFMLKLNYSMHNEKFFICSKNLFCINKKFIDTFINEFSKLYNVVIKKFKANNFDFILSIITNKYIIDESILKIENGIWAEPDEYNTDEKKYIIQDTLFKKYDNIILSPCIICKDKLKMNKITSEFLELNDTPQETNHDTKIVEQTVNEHKKSEPHKCCGGKSCSTKKQEHVKKVLQENTVSKPEPTSSNVDQGMSESKPLSNFKTVQIPMIDISLQDLLQIKPETKNQFIMNSKRDMIKILTEGFVTYCLKHDINPLDGIQKYNINQLINHILKD
jgi:hypothetical protein